MPAAIATSGLTRTFGGVVAVDRLDLDVPAGSIYGFLGPNGAGKTTTIRMLLGLVRPDVGEARLFGRRVDGGASGARGAVGALVEVPSLYGHLSGRENLGLLRWMLGLEPPAVEEILGTVGLLDDADRAVSSYSLGMRQRLGLALALVGSPSLLILDEPLNGLDPEGILEIRDLLRRLCEQGVTIFVSSHLLAEVQQVVSHVGILRSGRLAYQGPMRDLVTRSSPGLLIRAGDGAGAAAVLRQAGFAVEGAEGDRLRVPAGTAETPEIIRRLVEEGLDLYEVVEEKTSLEAAFLRELEGVEEDPA